MAKKITFWVVAVIGMAAASGVAWWHLSKPTMPHEIALAAPGVPASGARAPAAASSAPRVAGVEVAKAERATLQDDAVSVGSLRSRQNVVVRPEVPGRVMRLGFSDGGPVRRGQLLVQLDDTLQRAEIKQAQAQVSIAQANFKRNQELVAEKFVAQRVLDESAANLQVAEAQLALACARWSRMAIVAPFDGTVGIRNVNLGDFVKDGADLVNLEDLSSMYVDFRLPERYQGKLRLKQTVELQLDSIPGRVFKATVEAIDPLLDVNGRSVGVRAVLPNTMGEPLRAPGGRPGGPGGPVGQPGGAGNKAGPGGKPVAGGPPGADRSREARPPGAGRAPGANRATPGAMPVTSGSEMAVAAPARVATDIAGCPTAAERMAVAVEASRAQTPSSAPSVSGLTGGARRAGPAGAGAAGAADGAGAAPLRPGMFARVTTVFAITQAAIVVPEEAIVPQGGRQFVIKVVEPGAVPAGSASPPPPEVKFVSLRQEVKLGARQLGKVEITDGLVEGETVVVAGQQRLQRDGTPLRVVDLTRPGQGGAGAARGAASAPAAAASQ